jgi:hypothetical protein
MPFSIVNGAPPKETAIVDARGRVTSPWFAFLTSLQKSNSGVVVGLGGINLNGQTLTGSATFTGAVIFGVAPSFSDAAGTRTNLGLGSAALQPSSAFDAAGAATAAQAAAIAASLQRASNLSDLANTATARANLGLGSAALQPSSAFDAAGAATAAQAAAIAASLQRASNLSDLASAATARTNLGLGSAATQSTTAFDAAGAATAAQAAAIAASLQRASNLSDLASAATARTNLGAAALAGGNTFAGTQVISDALTISTPASVSIGSGWQNWTPTFTAWASMTVSGLTISDSQYLRIGPWLFFKLYVSAMTLGGTASNQIFFSLPVAVAGSLSLVTAAVQTAGAGGFGSAWAYCDPSGNLGKLLLPGAANYPLGSTAILVSGFYRCA